MFTAFVDTSEFNWWWLLIVPVVLVALFFLYRRLIRVERFQNRRLTVCIVLSVLAHLLLFSGAYMADFFKMPRLAGDGSIQISLDDPTDNNPIAAEFDPSIPTLDTTSQQNNAGDVRFEPVNDESTFDQPEDQPDTERPTDLEPPTDFEADARDATQFEMPDPSPDDALPNDSSSTEFAPTDVAPTDVGTDDATQFETPTDPATDDPFEAAVAADASQFEPPEFQFEPPEFNVTPDPAPEISSAPAFEPPQDAAFTDPSLDTPTTDASLTTDEPDAFQSLVERPAAQETPDFKPQTAPQAGPQPAPTPQPTAAQMATAQPSSQVLATSQPDPWKNQTKSASSDLVPVPRIRRTAKRVNRYQLRTAPDRMAEVRKRGGSADTEAAVAAALKWLANNQSDDGRWDADRHQAGRDNAVDGHYRDGAGRQADTGITGLAILSFLGNGDTHQNGDYRQTVAKGLEFLMSQQSHDGNMAGESLYYAQTYCHSIATLALSEAFAMTSDARLREFVERAIGFSIRNQQPVTGGWRYRPGQIGDMSQFGWQVMALTSADQAGIALRAEDRHLMSRFLRTVSTGRYGGLSSYRPNHGPTRTMTAEGLVCRVFLGQTADHSRLTEAANFVATQPPSTGPMNLYYWYYGTMAMFQYGGRHWEDWNAGLQKRLLPTQQSGGAMAGSWEPNSVWASYGGRVYSTAMAALCLEIYYRYLPLISEHRMATRP